MPEADRRAMDERVVSVLSRLCSKESIEKHDRTGGWFRRYYGRLSDREEARRFLLSVRNLIREGNGAIAGKDVLDLGCGFGLGCLVLALLGAREAHGIDLFRPMVETVEAWIPDTPEGGKVRPRVGLARELPYPDGSFDLVITIEALSHFLEPLKCLGEAHRVLRPGGLLVISDDNNAANPSIARRVREVWDRFENGPPTDGIHGHRVRVPYLQKRRAILQRGFPALGEGEIDGLARNTSYLVEQEVLQAAQRFVETGRMPSSPYRPGQCPIDPETGQYIENLLDPLALRRELERLGFEVRLEGYFGGESRGGLVLWINGVLNRLLPPSFTTRFSGGFRIRARKIR